MPCGLVGRYKHFEGTHCLHLKPWRGCMHAFKMLAFAYLQFSYTHMSASMPHRDMYTFYNVVIPIFSTLFYNVVIPIFSTFIYQQCSDILIVPQLWFSTSKYRKNCLIKVREFQHLTHNSIFRMKWLHHEDGGNTFLWEVGNHLQNHTSSQSRRQQAIPSAPSEPHTWTQHLWLLSISYKDHIKFKFRDIYLMLIGFLSVISSINKI
jgi:hypothetical protein